MEPVQLPKIIAPVMQTDRVKRAKPRENPRGGAGFGRYLHQGREGPASGPKEAPEEAAAPADAPDSEQSSDADGQTQKKLIDIRI
jgi:hypothetical protein